MPRVAEPPDPRIDLWAWAAFHLRFLRNQKGLSQAAVGKILSVSVSTVSRLELCQERMDESQAAKLDAAWDTGGIFGLIVHYASRGHEATWNVQHLNIEASAHIFRLYESLVIPGIFQTADYARALFLSGRFAADADRMVEQRRGRAVILDRDPPPDIWVILSQNALDWTVGGPEVHAAQLAHVLALAERSNIGIRVLPRDVGATAGLDGTFKILTADLGDVAFSESVGGGRLIQQPSEVRVYLSKFERISQDALNRLDSLALIRHTMEGLG